MQPSFDLLRAAMIDSQLRPNGVNDLRVIDAFITTKREGFVPPRLRSLAYLDEDLEIAPGRFLMEPLVFGNLVIRAKPRERDRVLLVGAGGGYEAAVLGRLAAHVTAVEEDAALAEAARANLAQAGVENVSVVEGPLERGWPDGAPYDVLFMNGAVEIVPDALFDQLVEGGRFVGVLLDETGLGRASSGVKAGGGIGTTAFMEAGVGRLPGFARPRRFVF